MDEVALYDRALTPKEAKAHFDAAGVTLVEGRNKQPQCVWQKTARPNTSGTA